MKKILATLSILCICFLTACPNNSLNSSLSSTESSTSEVEKPLEKFNAKSYGSILTWDILENAKGYEIYNADTNEKIGTTEENYYDLGEINNPIDVYVLAYDRLAFDIGLTDNISLSNSAWINIEDLTGVYRVSSSVTKLTLTGKNKDLSILIEERENDLELVLNNLSITTKGEYSAISGNASDNYNLSLICFGDNRIYAKNEKCLVPAIEISNLSIIIKKGIGKSNLAIFGNDGIKIKDKMNGAVAIKTKNLFIDAQSTLHVEGGRGARHDYGEIKNDLGESINPEEIPFRAGDGAPGIVTKTLNITENSKKVEIYGGHGGSADAGEDNALLNGKDGEDGKNGGFGGNGAVAVLVATPCELPNGVSLYSGSAGDGTSGGNGGNGGKGGQKGAHGTPGDVSENVGSLCINEAGRISEEILIDGQDGTNE